MNPLTSLLMRITAAPRREGKRSWIDVWNERIFIIIHISKKAISLWYVWGFISPKAIKKFLSSANEIIWYFNIDNTNSFAIYYNSSSKYTVPLSLSLNFFSPIEKFCNNHRKAGENTYADIYIKLSHFFYQVGHLIQEFIKNLLWLGSSSRYKWE